MTPPRWSDEFVRTALALPAAGASAGALPGYNEVSTDSRTLGEGALFVALSGPRFDGHNHLGDAAARGAKGAVVREGTAPVPGLVLYPVPDPLFGLGELARAERRRLRGPVVAVTGTNGKTSTKEMIAAVLRTRFTTHATTANLNNLIGCPRTILEATPTTDALVIEAGANALGEVARHRAIIDPTVGVITNVGIGHLSGFGSVDAVLREKVELVRDVPLAVVGTTPPALAVEARQRARRTVTAGLGDADVRPERLSVGPDGRAVVRVDGTSFTLPLPGVHLAENAMLAWAVVRELDLEAESAAQALATVAVPGGRGQVVTHGGLTIVNDAYNANPDSFTAAIATARAMRGSRPLVFVAGTMLELGARSAELHAQVARQLVDLEPDLLAVVGDFVEACRPFRARLGERLLAAPDPDRLGPALAERLAGDELIILKASRGVAMERILPYLLDGSDFGG